MLMCKRDRERQDDLDSRLKSQLKRTQEFGRVWEKEIAALRKQAFEDITGRKN